MSPKDMENILFLDIETVPLVYDYKQLDPQTRALWDHKWQYSRETTAEEQYAKAGIYAEFAKVICIGVGVFKHSKLTVSAFADDSEFALLSDFAGYASKNYASDKHFLCAHNGREFDFPFLCRRMLVNAIALPPILQLQGKKPWEIRHYDTMEMWKFGDYKNYSSLNLLSHVFNIPSPKDDMDGSMVARVYHEDRALKRIASYCCRDVSTMARVFCRLSGMPDLKEDQIIFA